MDNASIHRSRYVQALMATPEVDIKPLWNIAARPDLLTVGIEQVWARAKYSMNVQTAMPNAKRLDNTCICCEGPVSRYDRHLEKMTQKNDARTKSFYRREYDCDSWVSRPRGER